MFKIFAKSKFAHQQQKLLLVLILMSSLSAAALPANSKVLQGRLEADETIEKLPLRLERPKMDPGISEHCSCLDANLVHASEANGQWKLVFNGSAVLDFQERNDVIPQTIGLLKHYGITHACSVGEGRDELHYFLVNGESPSGSISGEDSYPFDLQSIHAEFCYGSWKVIDKNQVFIVVYGTAEEDRRKAEQAAALIKYHGFTQQCWVGWDHRAMMYFRK